MKRHVPDIIVAALLLAALVALTLRTPDPLDHAAPDSVWRREAGR